MKSALGILNDTKRDFQTIVKDFKAESKAMNKTLTKALKMKKIFTSDQLDQLSKLNHAIVDLASGIEINNKNESYTAMIKEKIKAFAAQCKVVSKFTDAKAVTESGCCGAASPEVKTEDDELTAPATAGSTPDDIEGSDLGGVETDTEGVQREERVRKSKAATAIQKQTGYDRATSKKIASDIDTVKAGSHRFDDFETQGRAPASRESLRDKLLDPEIEGVVKAHSSATTPKFKYKTDDSVSRAIATSDKLDNARDSMPKNAKDARKAISDVRDTVQTSGHKTLTTQQKGRTLDDDSVVDAIRNKK
jgi:ribosome-binding factor A